VFTSCQEWQHPHTLCSYFRRDGLRQRVFTTPALVRVGSQAPASARSSEAVPVSYPRVLHARNEKRLFAALFGSPLADSNRRPPPYHSGSDEGSAGTDGSPRPRKPRKRGGSDRGNVARAWTREDRLMFAPRLQGMRLGRQPLPATRTQVPGTEARPQTRLRGPVLAARSNARVDELGRARVALARF